MGRLGMACLGMAWLDLAARSLMCLPCLTCLGVAFIGIKAPCLREIIMLVPAADGDLVIADLGI